MEEAVVSEDKSFTAIVKVADESLKMNRRTATRYLERLTAAGLVVQGGGLYWTKGSKKTQ